MSTWQQKLGIDISSVDWKLWWNDATPDQKRDLLMQFDFSDVSDEYMEYRSWDNLPYTVRRTLIYHAEIPQSHRKGTL